MRLIAFPQGGSTSLGHILALMKAMRVFLWIFLFFSIFILKRAIVYKPLSLVFCLSLKAGPTLTAESLWLALGQGSLHRDMDALHVSESSPSALQGWFVEDFAGANQQILKAVMALWLVQYPLLFPSSLTSAWLPMPAA